MTDTSPLVSVIIPVYNHELYLAQAVESVIRQSYRPLEVIVVDDGSADGTAAIAKRFGAPVRYIWQTHSGSGAARNTGIASAQGDFIAFLDSDDLWTETKLASQMAAFANHPEADIVSGHVKHFHSPELPQEFREKIWCPEQTIPGHVVGAMLIRRDAFFRVGLFETHLQVGDVMSWWLRATDAGLRMIMLPECVYLRRLHRTNKGITQRQYIEQRVDIIKAALDRRRGRTTN